MNRRSLLKLIPALFAAPLAFVMGKSKPKDEYVRLGMHTPETWKNGGFERFNARRPNEGPWHHYLLGKEGIYCDGILISDKLT